ncbi:DUF4129 domain-containing transglutaminase family protein [Salinibacillus xinjiangensis]|uniref:DUF4129 domain-containing protein n=1 Tax=Salinibacillus xinjiangensis TaxID=1229268 RepID=A0A6G1X941_9BACI|nr:transglutaminase domain-containing protein [Salinibacillus xinjiangensis]MRG87390.1 DUF4129 domain-containing protein [Salinibacillus xinjiangensis]
MRLKQEQQPNQVFLNVVLYIGSFLLLWEWLRPLDQITDTGNVLIFILYMSFCFFLTYMQIQWWITFPLKLLGLLFILDGLFFQEQFLSASWFQHLLFDIQYNFSVMSEQQWWEMTALFRSMLFLILLWLMSYLLYYWFVIAKRTLFFVLLTFIYLTVVDTFTVYDAKYAIIRTFLISMIILGLTNFQRILIKEKIFRIPKGNYIAWVLPLIAIVLFSSVVGFAAPKYSPQWPDPVPFLKSTAENAGGGSGTGSGIKKVGYGENDERLGGAFVQDETVVFRAQVEDAQYWKIETKDVYTGKGWVRSGERPFAESDDGTIEFNDIADTVETEPQQATINFNNEELLPKLVYPYGLSQINLNGESPYQYSYSQDTGEIYPKLGNERVQMGSYEVSYDQPVYSLKVLREGSVDDPSVIQERYTQLPETLPQRVKDLAAEITADENNRYDKTKAVEGFFKSPDFQYSTTDVPVPDDNEDYVDQFLFESHLGYCDNFSTSMVVLLRSVDIPARWVKGFGAGEIVERNPTEGNTYEITNSNAHSWVEVYFPDAGWVPFEPTKGFYNPVDFTSGQSLEDLLNNQEEEDIPVSEMEEEPNDPAEEEEQGGSASFTIPWDVLLIVGLVLLAISGLLYWKRFTWMYWLKRRQFHKKNDVETYLKSYQFLLSLLNKKGIKREDDQTLREYARTVDRKLQSSEMGRLTYYYERILYRDDTDTSQWNKMRQLWENLINRVKY